MNHTQIENLIGWGKELGRVVVLGALSYLLTAGVLSNLLNIVFGAHLDVSVQLIIAGILASALKALDRQLHDSGVAEKGLVRF